MAGTSNLNDMTVGSPMRNIVRFAIPLVLGYMLQQMYLIADAAVVGRWIGVNALAAVGAPSSVTFLTMGFCNGVCGGFAIPVAQSFGAKDFVGMRGYVANAIRLAFIIATVLTVVCAVMTSKILNIVNIPSEIFDDAYTFLFLQFLNIPFTMAYNLLAGFIRALGDSKRPFYILIASSVVNIVFDLIFVIFFNMGVMGVGVATMLAQFLAVITCYVYITKKMPILIPTGDERSYDERKVGRLLNNGIPMGLQFSITGIGVIMMQSAINALGTMYVASFTTAMRVEYLFISVLENIGVAMATYCGQNIGAGQLQRVSRGIRDAIVIMMVYFLFTLVIIFPLADNMMALFVGPSEQGIIQNAAMFLRIDNVFYPILGILVILRYSIQGLGYSNMAMMSGVMEMIARVGVSLWLIPAFGFIAVCYGDPIAWAAADLFLVPAIFYLYGKLKKDTKYVSK